MPDKMQIKTYYANDDLLACPVVYEGQEMTLAELINHLGGWSAYLDWLQGEKFPQWHEHKRETERMRRAKAMRENRNSKGGQVGRSWKRKAKSIQNSDN